MMGMMLPVSDIGKLLFYREGLREFPHRKLIFLIQGIIIDALLFPFRWTKTDLMLPNKTYINTEQTAIINLIGTISKFMKKTLTLSPYGQSCAF